jgi:hypothetical protein
VLLEMFVTMDEKSVSVAATDSRLTLTPLRFRRPAIEFASGTE